MSGKRVFFLIPAMVLLAAMSVQAQKSKRSAKAPARPKPSVQAPTSVTVTLGDRKIVLSAPDGFVEPTGLGPNYTGDKPFAATPRELIALFIPREAFESGSSSYDNRVLVQVLRFEKDRLSIRKRFEHRKRRLREAHAKNGYGESLEKAVEKAMTDYRRLSPKEVVEAQRNEQSGVVDETDDSITFASLYPDQDEDANGNPGPVEIRLCFFSVVFVKNKVLEVYAYRTYRLQEDLAALKRLSSQLVGKILSENPSNPSEEAAVTPTSVTVALGDRSIVLPAPDGFVEPSKVQPYHQSIRGLLPDGFEVLAVYIPLKELESEAGVASTYTVIGTFPAMRNESVTQEMFEAEKQNLRQNFSNESLKPDQALVEELQEKYKRETGIEKKVQIGEPTHSRIIEETDASISFGAVLKYEKSADGNNPERTSAGVCSFVLTKGKMLFIGTVRMQSGPEAIDSLKDLSLQAVRKILEANKN